MALVGFNESIEVITHAVNTLKEIEEILNDCENEEQFNMSINKWMRLKGYDSSLVWRILYETGLFNLSNVITLSETDSSRNIEWWSDKHQLTCRCAWVGVRYGSLL